MDINDYENIDWSKNNETISMDIGLSEKQISKIRAKYGITVAIAKKIINTDWNKPNFEIADTFGTNERIVQSFRRKYATKKIVPTSNEVKGHGRSFLAGDMRKCTTCGKPTRDYRCKECWQKAGRSLSYFEGGEDGEDYEVNLNQK